jgi:hypothetical protein
MLLRYPAAAKLERNPACDDNDVHDGDANGKVEVGHSAQSFAEVSHGFDTSSQFVQKP